MLNPAHNVRDLIDLAVEYSLITSTLDFAQRSEKAKMKILQVMTPVWEEILRNNPL